MTVVKVRFGLIGCGRISGRHIEAMVQNPHAVLGAVCDIVPARMDKAKALYAEVARAAGRQVDIQASTTNYLDMLSAVDIDAVAICTESGNHATMAIAALNSGKHVLVEKPMALSIADADAMIALAEHKGLKLAVCHQNRFNPPVQELRKVLEAGMFGKLLHGVASVRWARDAGYYAQAPWRGTWAQDGGTLMNQCIHNIDLLQWMLGEVDHVYALTERFLRPMEAEDTGVAVLKFKSGALGVIEGSACIFPSNLEETLSIFGSTGTACLGGIAVNKIEAWSFRDLGSADVAARAQSQDIDSVYGRGHEPLYVNFVEAVRGKAQLLVDGIEGKKALEIVLGIYKSSRTKQPVYFPVSDYSTLTDLEV